MNKTDLSSYNNSWYNPGAGIIKRCCWLLTNFLFFQNPLSISSALKRILLRLFGAQIGKGVIIKPSINIKSPWYLAIGDHSWIGEYVWIDNLCKVNIGSHVCISQGALLLTGNHNYRSPTFELMIGEIILEDGVWLGAKSVVCPGVTCQNHAVLSVGSVATHSLLPYTIYQGNPALDIKTRNIGDQNTNAKSKEYQGTGIVL